MDQSRLFRSDFETRDLQKGQYKVEIHNIVSDGKEFVESSLGSSSVTRRVVMIVDRSDELALESSQTQDLGSALVVTGKIKDLNNGVITLRAFGPDNFTFSSPTIDHQPWICRQGRPFLYQNTSYTSR